MDNTSSEPKQTSKPKTTITVEVAYGLPEKQTLLALDVADGTTAVEAIEQSGILLIYPEINIEENPIGIFSKKCEKDTKLKFGDRVEIYRPLLADPKEVRKRRAAEMAAKKKKKG